MKINGTRIVMRITMDFFFPIKQQRAWLALKLVSPPSLQVSSL
jgi:hypothetical protein